MFNTLMQTLLEKSKEAENAIKSLRALNLSYQQMQKEKTYNNLKTLYKESSWDAASRKKHSAAPVKYMIMGRVVTPLLLANERVEMFVRESEPAEAEDRDVRECGHVEVKLQHMSIKDEASEVPLGKSQASSLKVKRSYTEMHKVDSANYDLFSVGVLNAIFAYIDHQCMKLSDLAQFNVIGRFAVVIYEVHAPELKALHTRIGVEMMYDNINLRVIKPYKQLYNMLIAVILEFGLENIATVSFSDYMDAVKHHIGSMWKPNLKRPVETFYECCRSLAAKKKTAVVSEFFEALHCTLMQLWEGEIVQRSNSFKRAKTEENPS